jgi:hypothetical protein
LDKTFQAFSAGVYLLCSSTNNRWVFAVCSSTSDIFAVNDVITITDAGDGSALVQTIIGGAINQFAITTSSPPNFLYGKACQNLWVKFLTINFQRSRTDVAYNPNNINLFLTILGLNTVRVLTGALTVQVTHTPNPIPVSIAPSFLNFLLQSEAFNVQECLDCNTNVDIAVPNPKLTGLPGLSNLRKFWNFAQRSGAVTAVLIKQTAFPNFQNTLFGLLCSPGNLQLLRNPLLTSLAGLSNLNTTIRPGPTVRVVDNPLLTSRASVIQLTPLAACVGAIVPSPLTSFVNITTTECVATVGHCHSLVHWILHS